MFKKAASLVAKRGYDNIMTFRGGIPEWVKAGYPLEKTSQLPDIDIPAIEPDVLAQRLADVTVVDIRTPALYAMGWIGGSIKIPLALLSAHYADIPVDKEVVVVDHAGKQVGVAARFLQTKGYRTAVLPGGLKTWVKAHLPLEK